MANLVEQILTEATTIALTVMGAGSQELRYKYEIERNDIRTAKFAFGVRPLGAVPAETVTKSFTLDHLFETVLTDTIPRDHDDTQRNDALNVLYDKADDIFRAMINSKIGLPLIVFNISQPTLPESEYFEENSIIVLRMQYVVKYRSLL